MESPSATSQILADRLRTRRIESRRSRRQTDFGPIIHNDFDDNADDIFLAEAKASEPIADLRASRRLSMDTPSRSRPADAADRKRQPGLREMDEKLQKLERLNFDLKMEVFHRREREEKLQEQVKGLHKQLQVAAKLQQEHAALLRLNKELSTELDKSSEAVDQAVRMICDLEAKVESLEQRALNRSQSTSYTDSGYAASSVPVTSVVAPTPPRKRASVESVSARQPRALVPGKSKQDTSRNRVPSFMSNPAADNMALREAYGGAPRTLKQAQSFISMFTQSTEDEAEKLHDLPSPPLSALSESELASVYRAPAMSEDAEAAADLTPRRQPDSMQDTLKRINKWMELDRGQSKVEFTLTETNNGIGLTLHDTRPSTTESAPRPSTTGSNPSPSFQGWPDGGSIVTGTPSRFRTSSSTGGTTSRSRPTPEPPVSPTPRRQPQSKRLSLAGRLFDKLSIGSHPSKPDRGRGLARSSTVADMTPSSSLQDRRKSGRPASLSRNGAQVAWERGK